MNVTSYNLQIPPYAAHHTLTPGDVVYLCRTTVRPESKTAYVFATGECRRRYINGAIAKGLTRAKPDVWF